MVVRRGSSRRGGFSGPALSRPNILVQRLRPGMGGYGCRPPRVRHLVGGRGLSLHQSVLVAGSGEGSQGSLLLASRSCDRSFLRQYDRGVVSEESRRDFGSGPQLCCAEDSALGGA